MIELDDLMIEFSFFPNDYTLYKRSKIFLYKYCVLSSTAMFNPISAVSAGVLENQDMLGGGQFAPPPLNPMFDVQI